MTDHSGYLKKTPLYNRYVAHGAKMVLISVHELPVKINEGILTEHCHTQSKVSLYDVGHLGQKIVKGNEVNNVKIISGTALAKTYTRRFNQVFVSRNQP